MAALQLVIEGLVRRVGYRDWAVRTAKRNGVSGWVRNLGEDRVEMLAIASEQGALDAFVEQCRQGPPSATVTHIDVRPADRFHGVKGFTKRFTVAWAETGSRN